MSEDYTYNEQKDNITIDIPTEKLDDNSYLDRNFRAIASDQISEIDLYINQLNQLNTTSSNNLKASLESLKNALNAEAQNITQGLQFASYYANVVKDTAIDIMKNSETSIPLFRDIARLGYKANAALMTLDVADQIRREGLVQGFTSWIGSITTGAISTGALASFIPPPLTIAISGTLAYETDTIIDIYFDYGIEPSLDSIGDILKAYYQIAKATISTWQNDITTSLNLLINSNSHIKQININNDTYKVQSGDSLWQIANKLGISKEDLIGSNPWLSDRTSADGSFVLIKPGEELNLPDSGLWKSCSDPFLTQGMLSTSSSFIQAENTPLGRVDPLFLDLDGDGLETTNINNGVYFDLDKSGFAEKTAWVGNDDGVLALDRNNDGIINNGGEIFGDQTLLNNGTLASNGYQALAEFDTNSDGKIDVSDTAYSQLKVLKGDGTMSSLSDLGIKSINLNYTTTNINNSNGNTQIQTGTYTKTDNTTRQTGGFVLNRDASYSIATEWLDVPADISVLPDAQGFGNVYTLHQAMVRDANLKALVQSFVNEEDRAIRQDLLDQILSKWTGSENVDPSSRWWRSTGLDSRKLAILEKFMGHSFQNNPNSMIDFTQSYLLNQAYDNLKTYINAQFVSQTHLKEFFDLITIDWNEQDNSINLNFTNVIYYAHKLGQKNSNLFVLE